VVRGNYVHNLDVSIVFCCFSDVLIISHLTPSLCMIYMPSYGGTAGINNTPIGWTAYLGVLSSPGSHLPRLLSTDKTPVSGAP
jgi:hypothetical protein